MKKFYLIFILTCFYAILLDCIAKESIVFEYDAAGNRTARYIVTEDSDEQPGALRGAFAESDDITKSESPIILGDLTMEAYPNPTNGPVVIDIKGDTDQPMNVEVFSFPAAVGIPRAQLGPPPIPATTRFPTRAARLRPAPGALPTFTTGSR